MGNQAVELCFARTFADLQIKRLSDHVVTLSERGHRLFADTPIDRGDGFIRSRDFLSGVSVFFFLVAGYWCINDVFRYSLDVPVMFDQEIVVVCWLLNVPAVYLRDGSAQTILRAAALTEAADQTFYLTQSQYADTGPISPSADPITPGA